jgi:hypothetical protein
MSLTKPSLKSPVSDIAAGDGKTANVFYSVLSRIVTFQFRSCPLFASIYLETKKPLLKIDFLFFHSAICFEPKEFSLIIVST